MHFYFFSVCCIITNCSWQLMLDKKQKTFCKTCSFSSWWWFTGSKSFYKVKNCFLFILDLFFNFFLVYHAQATSCNFLLPLFLMYQVLVPYTQGNILSTVENNTIPFGTVLTIMNWPMKYNSISLVVWQCFNSIIIKLVIILKLPFLYLWSGFMNLIKSTFNFITAY